MMKKIRITKKEIVEGRSLPPWYYGHAFTKWSPALKDIFVYYPIPFNLLIRWGMTIRFIWDLIRGREGVMDCRIRARMNTLRAKAYRQGVTEGKARAVDELSKYVKN